MKKFCFALDLVDDPDLIAQYDNWHRTENNWPEINRSITEAGITDMEIYRTGNRLMLIMETIDSYSADKKAAMDAGNPKVQEWEQLMWQFQQPLRWAKEGEKWIAMDRIFKLG